MKPRLFIGSSSENLDVAHALQESLEQHAQVTVWDQAIFGPSKYALESLLEAVTGNDFAAFVFAPDDVLCLRGQDFQTARDNVIFELGLFIGRLGERRSFILVPASADQLRVPTDLLGLNVLKYDDRRTDGNLVAAVGSACSQIRRAFAALARKRDSQPNAYSYGEFAEIERSATQEVWILRPHYMLEADSFYDVVADNLSRGVRYRYFVPPDFDFADELELLRDRFRRDSRMHTDPADLLTVEYVGSSDMPLTFVLIDPDSPAARGFAIIENELRGPGCWIEISKGQVVRYVAGKLRSDREPGRGQSGT
jgi:hypothetical protein